MSGKWSIKREHAGQDRDRERQRTISPSAPALVTGGSTRERPVSVYKLRCRRRITIPTMTSFFVGREREEKCTCAFVLAHRSRCYQDFPSIALGRHPTPQLSPLPKKKIKGRAQKNKEYIVTSGGPCFLLHPSHLPPLH